MADKKVAESNKKFIPVCVPWLPGNERKYVLEALDTNWISSAGMYLEKFEEHFAKFCGSNYGVSCSNCFAALHLACMALGLKKGDEVIVPTFTMSAPVNAVILTGATPVFVDADKETFCIDADKIEEKISRRTKAIIAVHIYGHPCAMDKIRGLAKKYNLKIIEDAAEAHGAEYKGKKTGSIGDIGCFSFYGNKILTTGEGGMAITNNKELAEKMKKLRNYAFEHPRFLHREFGVNYRLTNIQAAIGFAQTENADKLVTARKKIGEMYTKYLKGTKGLVLPVEKPECKNVYWMYGIVLTKEIKATREEITERLKARGIDTRTFFIPMHQQPVFIDGDIENAPDCSGHYPIAEALGRRGFYLPSSSTLTEEVIQHVAKQVKEVLAQYY
jgi:perosamine synthetase